MLANMGSPSPRIQKIELCMCLKRRLPLVSCELQARGDRLVYGPCSEAVGDVGFEDAITPWSLRRVQLWREAFFCATW